MNSIQDLNNYGNQPITYTDGRSSTVLFDLDIPLNPSVNIVQAQTFSLPVGINITEIINYADCATRYVIDTRNLAGVTVTWATVPTGVTVTESPTGVWTVSGLESAEQWEIIKSPTVTLPSSTYVGNFVISSKIDFLTRTPPNLKTWTVAVGVRAAVQMTEPEDFYYDAGVANAITGTPEILDELQINPATWTVTVTSDDNTVFGSLSTAGSGGSSTWNSGTYTLTITGTKTQVNSHLDSVTYTAPVGEEDQFTLTYSLTNSSTASTVTKTQTMYGGTDLYFFYTRGDAYYNEDTPTTINNGPLISDVAHAGSGTYTLTIGPNTANAVASMSSSGTGGTSSWNNSTKILTITGTRDQCNSRINNLTLTPATDYRQDFRLNYTVAIPTGGSGTRSQRVYIAGADADIVNMNITRYYNSNSKNLIFSTATPEIVDTDPSNPTYTIFLTSTLGYFGVNGAGLSQNWSYSGTKAQINALFSQIEFYPLNGVISNGSFSYTQKKGTTTMVTVNVGLYYQSPGGPITANTYIFTNAFTNWQPPPEQALYLQYDILVVGGGGGGSGAMGGGGGGGGVVYVANQTMPNAGPFKVYVGAGGAGGGYESAPAASYGSGGGSSEFTWEPWSDTYRVDYTGYYAGGGNGGYFNRVWKPATSTYEYTVVGGASGNSYQKINGTTVVSSNSYPAGSNTVYNQSANNPWTQTGPGGGGAGGAGGTRVAYTPGAGGAAVTNSITGITWTLGSGGPGTQTSDNNYIGNSVVSTYGGGGRSGWTSGDAPGLTGASGQSGVIVIKFHS